MIAPNWHRLFQREDNIHVAMAPPVSSGVTHKQTGLKPKRSLSDENLHCIDIIADLQTMPLQAIQRSISVEMTPKQTIIGAKLKWNGHKSDQ